MNDTYFNAQKAFVKSSSIWVKNHDKMMTKNFDKNGDMTFWQFQMAYTFDYIFIYLLNSCLFVY